VIWTYTYENDLSVEALLVSHWSRGVAFCGARSVGQYVGRDEEAAASALEAQIESTLPPAPA